MIIININEFVLSLNKFNTPKTLKDKEAIYTLITRLLLLEPGTIQSHPEMGVGLISRYRYAFADKARDLKQDITNQIAKYLPQLQGVEVLVNYEDGAFSISISIDSTVYNFNYNSESGTLDSLKL